MFKHVVFVAWSLSRLIFSRYTPKRKHVLFYVVYALVCLVYGYVGVHGEVYA